MIHVYKNNREVVIKTKDNGIGYIDDTQYKGFGLRGIKERLQILNGTIRSGAAQPTGTVTVIHIPLPHLNDNAHLVHLQC